MEATILQFNQLYKDNSRKALTSGNLTEVPDKSVFVKYLIKELEENEDLFLSSAKLFTRMYEPIVNNAPTIPQYGVIQGAGDEGGILFLSGGTDTLVLFNGLYWPPLASCANSLF